MTVLAFYLVDPDLSDGSDFEILTTSSVPPQQKHWMRRALEESLDLRIPNEVVERIMEFVVGVMSEEEAQTVEEAMRREREWFRISHDRYWFNLPFDVWSGERHL